MENSNIERQISPDEIDAEIHQRILTEERFLKWKIGVSAVVTLGFLCIAIAGIFGQNSKAVIIFGIITVIIMFAVIGFAGDYRKIKKQTYPCYLCRIEEFIDNQYLRVNSDVKAIYSREDFRDVYLYESEEEEAIQDSEEEDFQRTPPKEIEAILINSVDDHWYAFSMKWYRGVE